MALPDPGDLLWGTPLNAYIEAVEAKADAVTGSLTTHTGGTDPHNVLPTAAADATSKVSAHTAAPDPHGDRGYADGAFAKLAGTSTTVNPVLTPSATGNVALALRAIASQTANTLEVRDSGGTARVYVQPAGALFAAQGLYSTGNTQLGSATAQWGGGSGVVGLGNATTPPSTNPAAGVVIYAEGGTLKARTADGTIQQIAPFAAAGSGVPLAGGGVIQPSAIGVVPLTIKQIAAQTADVLKLQDSAGNDKIRISNTWQMFLDTGADLRVANGVQVGGISNTWGGGAGILGLTNATTAPTTNPSGGLALYSEAGVLKARTPTGITQLAPAAPLVSVAATRAAATAVAVDTVYNAVFTAVSWENPDTWWTSGGNLTTPQTGKYLATVKAVFQAAGLNNGSRFIYLMDYNGGGTPVILAEASMTAPGGGSFDWLVLSLSDVITLTAGQQIFMRVRHTNAEPLNVEQFRLTLTYQGT